MSNPSFARRYWSLLTGADKSGNSPTAGRGRAGYAFWQRYWAAFTAADLPVQETVTAGGESPAAVPSSSRLTRAPGPAPTGQRQAPSPGGSGVPSLPDDPAAEFSRTSPGRYVVDGQEADVRLEAAPAGAGTFTVTVRTSLAGTRGDGITVWLEAHGRYFLTLLTAEGLGTFEDVPGGPWSLGFLSRPENSPDDAPVSLPLSQGAADLAAASEGEGTAILKVTMPDSRTNLALHRQDAREYLLEVSIPDAPAGLEIVTVRYGTSDGGVQRVLIPVSGGAALTRLPDYAPRVSWAASAPVRAGEIRSWDASVVRTSFRAAVGGRTKSAWRAIGAFVPEVRQLTGEAPDE